MSLKRKRSFFRLIQRLIEFYLSDANLRRDIFLRSQLNDNLEVDLSVFLKFNRIRSIGAGIEDLRIALNPSHVLELLPGNRVRRRKPIVVKSKEEVDQCTLYIERVPPDATPEAISRVFCAFGEVVMVTLPKYSSNKRVKGYGFVEFAQESSCAAAIERFARHGGVLASDVDSCNKCMGDPPELEVEALDETETDVKKDIPKTENIGVVPGSHKVGESMIPVTECTSSDKEPAVAVLESDAVKCKTNSGTEEDSEATAGLTFTRKRNRKKKKWQRKMNFPYMGLQIMSKVTWNRLRTKYLSLQAANRRNIKAQLAKIKRPSQSQEKLRALVPGSLLTLSASKQVTEAEAKSLKMHLRQVDAVEYVDIEGGQRTGYVRMASAEAANCLLDRAQDILPGYTVELLPPSAEDLYWIKIQHDRVERFKAYKAKKNVGGAKKIMLRAEKHLGVKMRLSPDQN